MVYYLNNRLIFFSSLVIRKLLTGAELQDDDQLYEKFFSGMSSSLAVEQRLSKVVFLLENNESLILITIVKSRV